MVELVAQIKDLVSAVLEDERQLTEDDIMTLFSARGVDFDVVCEAAGAHLQSQLVAKAIRTTALRHHCSSAQLGHFSILIYICRLTGRHSSSSA